MIFRAVSICVWLIGSSVFLYSCLHSKQISYLVKNNRDSLSYQNIQDSKTSNGFKNLGPQITNNMVQGSTFVIDRNEKELLYTVVRGQTAHLVGVDLSTRAVMVNLPLEGSDGSWDIKVSSDGLLYVSSSRGKLYKHVPGTIHLDDLGRPLSGETYLWDLAAGKDGEIFGASYPGCRVFRYHSDDGFSDVGKGALVPNESYVRSIVYHKETDMIYAGIGSHAHLVELNPRTGEKREFLPPEYKNQEFVYHLSIVKDDENGDRLLIYLTKSAKTLVYNIRSKAFEDEMSVDHMYVKTTIKSEDDRKAYFTASGKLYEWGLDAQKPKYIEDVNSNALASKWANNGMLYLFNTRKELIKYDIHSSKKTVIPLDIPALPVKLNYVAVGPDNQLWTGGYLSGSNATYDPKSNKTTSYPGLSQTESMAFLGSDIYFGVYPSCRIYIYDTQRPWSIREKNPRLISRVNGQDRPFGGISVEELNKVFFGTVPSYGKNGGSLVEYDISADKLNNYPNVVQNQSIISLVYSQGLLYGGSSNRGGLGIAPTESEAKMFIWDPINKRKIREIIPVENAKSISYLAEAPDKKIWGIATGTLFIYDPVSQRVVSTHKLYDFKRNIGVWTPGAIFFHSNGDVYVQDASNLYRVTPKTMQFDIIQRPVNHLTMDENGMFYFLKGEELWQYIP